MKHEATKTLKYNRLDRITMVEGEDGQRVPFYLRYVSKDGELIEEDNVICTSSDHATGTRRVKFLNSQDSDRNAQTRTLRDCLILQVNETGIVKS